MTWNDYEEVVKTIYDNIGKGYGVKIEGYGHTCKRTGKSGTEYQIDVLTSNFDGIHTYYTAIECKYWKDKVTKNVVSDVMALVEDCNFDAGIIVTKTGFTPDAIKLAEHNNIRLVELDEHH